MKLVEINGYDGKYLISDDGSVWSNVTNKFLTVNIDMHGYLGVGLQLNGKPKRAIIHRLVAEAFIPNDEDKPQVNHIDGDKLNNSVSNLEWTTAKENSQHAQRKGLVAKTNSYRYSHLDEETVRVIYSLKGKMSQRKAAEKFGVGRGAIRGIFYGKTWKHITCKVQAN